MEAFATIADLNARREKPITEEQESRARALLLDASALLASELRKAGVDYKNNDDDLFILTLQSVTCSIVNRAIKSENLMGIESTTQITGPYNFTYSYSNPSDNLYITAAEKRQLGIDRGKVWTMHANIRCGGRPCR